ncbi:hypothetical protein [Aquabacterium sp.]|uniref:hypothetical protein n=1 Tax=Aquabacterium sp. TaxID=1872578 RepID=UPI0025BAD100|nr:hypothetical protein [Aquabacterium sp.]
MRQIAPLPRVTAPLPPARPVVDAGNLRSSTTPAHKAPAVNQPWFGRDDCHCDDGPERMSKRSVHGRW